MHIISAGGLVRAARTSFNRAVSASQIVPSSLSPFQSVAVLKGFPPTSAGSLRSSFLGRDQIPRYGPRGFHTAIWGSPATLRAQARTSAALLSRFERKISSMASENAYKGLLTSLPKPGGGEYGKYYSLTALNDPRTEKLPYSVRILLEAAIRNCDNFQVTKDDVEKILDWENTSPKQVEIPFKPARVLLHGSLLAW